MTLSERIRALIPSADKAMTHGAIVDAIVAQLPDVKRWRVADTIVTMFKRADPPILARIGEARGEYAYYVARPVQINAYATEEERKAAVRANELARRPSRRERAQAKRAAERAAQPDPSKRKPPRPREVIEAERQRLVQSRADRAAAKAERAEAREAARLKREAWKASRAGIEAQRAAWRERRAQQRAKRAAMPPREKSNLPKRTLTGTPAPPARSGTMSKIAPVLERRETVEAWMKRTGCEPEVLPAGVFLSPAPRVDVLR